jgi:hypothetical protein
MADRYWIGPGAYWDNYGGEDNWSLTSGGSPGAAVPTSSDNVYFDANSGSGNVYITISIATVSCANLSFAGFTGTFGGPSSSSILDVYGNLTLSSSMSFYTYTNTTRLRGTGSQTITTNGKTFSGPLYVEGNYTLQDALTVTDGFSGDYSLKLNSGTLNTNGFALTTSQLYTTGGTLTLGSSTVTITGGSAGGFSYSFYLSSGVTLNAGTSSIVFAASSVNLQWLYIASPPVTFYNVTANGLKTMYFTGAATFNNLTFSGSSGAYLQQSTFIIDSNLTVSNTLTISAASDPNLRTCIKSNTVGVQRTISAPSFTAGSAYCDFRNIAITGAAAPISGTSFGDCNGNSGITFSTPKTVYWVGGTGTFKTNSFAATSGGAAASANYPIAQDTLIIDDNSGGAGISIGLNGYVESSGQTNISGVNASSRTLTYTVTPSSSVVYKDFIVNSLATVNGSNLTFSGGSSQALTQNGATWSCNITIWSSSTVQLNSAFSSSRSSNQAVSLISGTFNLNNYTLTLTGASSGFYAYSITPGFYSKSLAMGTSTMVLSGTGGAGNYAFQGDSGLVVTGTGTISLTSASNKSFFGGNNSTYPTINQGGAGVLTIFGNNSFTDITNTYSATGATTVRFQGGRENVFANFNLTGTVGKVCTLGSSSTARVTLSRSTGQWLVGSNSTNGGNNSGLSFTSGGGIDYLSISYVNGITTQNGFLMF